jgi:hypothetical protein
MKWTPKKTTIALYMVAFVVDVGLAALVGSGVLPVGTETASILQKVFIGVGVVLVLQFVRAIASRETDDLKTVPEIPTCQKCSFPLEVEAKFCIYCNAPVD